MATQTPLGQEATVWPVQSLPPPSRRRRYGVRAVLVALVVFLAVFAGCVYQVAQGLPDLDGLSGDGLGDEPPEPLAVAVAPATGLDDATAVLVSVTDAEPGGVVEITTCLAGVDAATLDDLCHAAGGASFTVPADGVLGALVPVRRVITTTDGVVDCAERAGRCAVVAHADPLLFSGAATRRTGGQPVTFAAGLPPAGLTPETMEPLTDRLPATISPGAEVAVGTEVVVTASGFVPGEDLAVGLCSDDAEHEGFLPTCTALSASRFDITSVAETPAVRADESGAVTYRTTVRASFTPSMPGQDGRVECAERPGRCTIVVAAAADTQRSAYLPLTVTG